MYFAAVLLFFLVCSVNSQATVTIKEDVPLAKKSSRLTAVTIDICALKNDLQFNDPLLVKLSQHLAPTVLRIGGTDQNNFYYNMENKMPMPTCECGRSCTMTAPYWAKLQQFLMDTNLTLLFGLSRDVANATDFIQYNAKQNYSQVYAYSWGNEVTGDSSLAKMYLEEMTQVRDTLVKAYPSNGGLARPLLVGADTGVGPRRDSVPSNFTNDTYITSHLQWIDIFTETCAKVLDAVSWHTYDYRSTELGGEDHHPLPYPAPDDFKQKFWNPAYHQVAVDISQDITSIVKKNAPSLANKVWLSEMNSICHQGVYNVTNAFANTLWIADRFGLMSANGVDLMARQSLIGFNYSLLGNFPAEPIFAAPDYYTTVLFNKLTGDNVLELTSSSSSIRSYGFCGKEKGFVLMLININQTETVEVTLAKNYGSRNDYVLTPHWPDSSAPAPAEQTTSRHMALNGNLLSVSEQGDLPAFEPVTVQPAESEKVKIAPLTMMFAEFPTAQLSACQ
eukprot:m.29361 g.29361  ORF g.29361 m.29361 type:complete len:505 (+) comp8094_c0_seq1:160-1674(+)